MVKTGLKKIKFESLNYKVDEIIIPKINVILNFYIGIVQLFYVQVNFLCIIIERIRDLSKKEKPNEGTINLSKLSKTEEWK